MCKPGKGSDAVTPGAPRRRHADGNRWARCLRESGHRRPVVRQIEDDSETGASQVSGTHHIPKVGAGAEERRLAYPFVLSVLIPWAVRSIQWPANREADELVPPVGCA